MSNQDRQDNAEPSRELWKYVLYHAISDLVKPKGHPNERRFNRQSALYWFNSDNEDINSFLGICDTLGVDPDKTRAAILNKKRRG